MSTTQRTKIVSIGDEETALGFKLAGISEAYTVEPEKASQYIRMVANNPEVAIVIVTEEVAKANENLIRELKKEPFPVFVEVPGKKAKFEESEDKVRALIKMALGIDIELNK